MQCVNRILPHSKGGTTATRIGDFPDRNQEYWEFSPAYPLSVSVDFWSPLTPNDLLKDVANLLEAPTIHEQPDERCAAITRPFLEAVVLGVPAYVYATREMVCACPAATSMRPRRATPGLAKRHSGVAVLWTKWSTSSRQRARGGRQSNVSEAVHSRGRECSGSN